MLPDLLQPVPPYIPPHSLAWPPCFRKIHGVVAGAMERDPTTAKRIVMAAYEAGVITDDDAAALISENAMWGE